MRSTVMNSQDKQLADEKGPQPDDVELLRFVKYYPWLETFVKKHGLGIFFGFAIAIVALYYFMGKIDRSVMMTDKDQAISKDAKDLNSLTQDLIITTVEKGVEKGLENKENKHKFDNLAHNVQQNNKEILTKLDRISTSIDQSLNTLLTVIHDHDVGLEAGTQQFKYTSACQENLSYALADLRDLEIYVSKFRPINLNSPKIPGSLVVKIRVILRHLGWVKYLSGDRISTNITLQQFQKWAKERGYHDFGKTELGYFGSDTIEVIRTLLLNPEKLACDGSDGYNCFYRNRM